MSTLFAIAMMNQPTPMVVPGTCVAKRDMGSRHEDGNAGGFVR